MKTKIFTPLRPPILNQDNYSLSLIYHFKLLSNNYWGFRESSWLILGKTLLKTPSDKLRREIFFFFFFFWSVKFDIQQVFFSVNRNQIAEQLI